MRNGVAPLAPSGTARAITEPSRTTISRAPGRTWSRQSAVSSSVLYPAAPSRRAASAAAWNELGEAETKAARSSMWAGEVMPPILPAGSAPPDPAV